MVDLLTGIRHGFRALRTEPGFSAVSIAVLATGIGATTLMFTLVQGVLLRALPFADPEQLVWMYNTRTERDRAPLSLPDYEDYRRESSTLADLALFTNWTTNLTGVGAPERVEGVRVSGNFFELLGTTAVLGRVLRREDEEHDARVAVLTHGLWMRRFGGNSAILGKGVSLNGATYVVVGVLPPRFVFPFREAEIGVPISVRADPRRVDRGANFLRVVARLAPHTSLIEARADLNAIARRLQQLYPTENSKKIGISLYPLHAEIVRDYRTMLWTLFGSVGVLLLVGCVNLANLLLVRAAGRQNEFAVRLSLGASGGRLIRQLFGETILLAILGAAFALVLAYIGLAAWRAWGPADFPQMAVISLDTTVLLFALSVSAMTAFVCGVAPAWFASREAMLARSGTARTITTSRAHISVQRAFVSAQIAAATLLLIAMLLMGRGFARLEQVAPGFATDHAVTIQLSLPPATYAKREGLTRFFETLRDRLDTLPGVESAGAVSLLPLSGLLSTVDVALLDRAAPPLDEVPQAHFRIATPEYFDAAGIQILDGRSFDARDTEKGQPVAIVSRTFAKRHWPGERAIGRFVQIIQVTRSPAMEIVAVVEDVKQFAVDAPATSDLYVPLHQIPAFQVPLMAARMNWVVRARGDVAVIAQHFRAAVAQVDPEVAASRVRTLEGLWQTALGSRRAHVRLLQAFGDVALALCAIGVYGVTAFSARTRKRELAIRAALGATQRELTCTMLRRELRPVLAGLGCGLLLALIAAPHLFANVYATGPRDAVTYAEVAGMLLTVATIATYLPIRRAGRTNPSEALVP